MKKNSVVFLVFFILFTLLSFHSHAEKGIHTITIYVDDDNISGPWEGTIDHPYQCIQDAIDAA
ncbi:MAG: hypothetical protein R6U21_01050 [Thermoplasmatota archaeon]